MSVKTWVKEYYHKSGDPEIIAKWKNNRQALNHALRKFIGARPVNLKKHNVVLKYGHIINRTGVDNRDFTFNTYSCALCAKYHHHSCIKCPLRKGCIIDDSWGDFASGHNPEPMIEAIRLALKNLTRRKG